MCTTGLITYVDNTVFNMMVTGLLLTVYLKDTAKISARAGVNVRITVDLLKIKFQRNSRVPNICNTKCLKLICADISDA